ncbi:2-oxoacid:ferredoxin oxidoreductase subunit beta [Sphingobacteriales bacterium UPWRP_1]|nr:2-oxoacid:ferredoxin oxidoreductase subunit beta [Sphingobacteriales bacterium TSM_CSM]PSJ75441.1 2-oxoacid:ferredoxin oxidoreductase subunit beta [Sphingobacteriales bacterium UPWRP_1]
MPVTTTETGGAGSGAEVLKAKDFATDQEVRWCPGCGDYSILKQVQTVIADLGLKRENVAIISGIGCSSRFPYYMETYGMHSIHGRATAVASGLRIANPQLSVWVVTGDGDGLSIGGNHLLHILRRNFNLNILLFNNQIYGLTKGQYSPTSEQHKITKSTPLGSVDYPVNPVAFALGANATFVARAMDRDPKHLQEMVRRSYNHRGASFLEIYQNCNIFNDGAFELFTESTTKKDTTLFMEHDKPLLFGQNNDKGILLDGYSPRVVNLANGEFSTNDLWIHNEYDLVKAQILSRFFDLPQQFAEGGVFLPRPFGVFYVDETRPAYEELVHYQIQHALDVKGKGNLDDLIAGSVTWVHE